jgi:HlyD family secretion protein
MTIMAQPGAINTRRCRAGVQGVVLFSLWLFSGGCAGLSESAAQTGAPPRQGNRQPEGAIAVEAAIAKPGSLEAPLEYTGTTRPVQEVTVRARIDGQIMSLTGDVGDRLQQGEILAQLDGDLLTVAVTEARSELAARNSEIAQAQAAVSDAQTLIVQAQATLNQAQADAERLQRLAAAGASSQQAAEQALLALETARQAVRSAQEQVSSRQQAVKAAQGRFQAQQAVVDQSQQRLAYAGVTAPITGVILARFVDPGDYVEAGANLFSLGDLRALTITLQVSEFDLSRISLGQPAQVQLDAFPDQTLSGRVTRISPLADTNSRLVPLEIRVNNPEGKVGSGLMARVSFSQGDSNRIVIPAKALTFAPEGSPPTLFVLQQTGDQATVVARRVEVGQQLKDQVEILSGLNPGESYVNASEAPLETGQAVRISILSEVNP